VPLTLAVLWLTFAMPEETWAQRLAWALTTPVVFYAGWPKVMALSPKLESNDLPLVSQPA